MKNLSTFRRSIIIFFVLIISSIFVACQIGIPVPTPTPTKTLTPTATVTITLTPTIDPWNVVHMPQVEFVVATLAERFESFNIITGYGVKRDTLICVGFEQPAYSGELYLAIYASAEGRWQLVDIIRIDSPLKSEGK